jgi:hypothetical protein
LSTAKAKTATAKRRTNKYGAKPTVVDGRRFASKLEAARYRELKARVNAGDISDLECQIPFQVFWPGHEGDRRWLLFTYIADFSYVRDGQTVVEDTKGRVLNEFRLKKKGVMFAFGVDVIIVTRKRMTWYFNGKPEEHRYY